MSSELLLDKETAEKETTPVPVTMLSTKSVEHEDQDKEIVARTQEYANEAMKTMSEFYGHD